jgi:hypothetical protein
MDLARVAFVRRTRHARAGPVDAQSLWYGKSLEVECHRLVPERRHPIISSDRRGASHQDDQSRSDVDSPASEGSSAQLPFADTDPVSRQPTLRSSVCSWIQLHRMRATMDVSSKGRDPPDEVQPSSKAELRKLELTKIPLLPAPPLFSLACPCPSRHVLNMIITVRYTLRRCIRFFD